MAARRLLIVMLVLLGISTLAAALVPPRAFRDQTGSTATETEATETAPATGAPQAGQGGQAVQVRIFVGGRTTPVVPLALGDQLSLTVCTRETTDLLEIPLIGRVEPVRPGVPTYFNLLPRQKGSYALRFVEKDSVAARIEVSARKPAAPGEPAQAARTDCPAPARR